MVGEQDAVELAGVVDEVAEHPAPTRRRRQPSREPARLRPERDRAL
jgi:hypothetical protein